ncbi:MAG: glutaredoxin domain-containing protein [Patescibacteria group bacterium]
MAVKIYTTPTCVYCKIAKEFFTKHNVKYEEYDVFEDLTAREEMINKSHQLGVPVIDVNGEIFIGFNRSAIAKSLGITS